MFKTPPITQKNQSCSQCNGMDTMDMVQCDSCDKWFHFQCAGVNQSIENHAWICSMCEENVSKFKGKESPIKGKYIPVKNAVDFPGGEVKKSAKAKTTSIKLSVTSSRKTKIDLELQQLEEEKALEKKFLEKKFEILARSEKGSEKSISSDGSQYSLRTRQWVSKLPEPTHQKHVTEPLEVLSNGNLTYSKIAARQALAKDLPIFSGKPEEWPVFLSSYEESTKNCGFSNSENLLRLQRALKGKAYDVVSSQLLLPKNVPQIVATLKMMFGRPEVIINSLIEKIRSEPSPKAERLDTIISYAISVKNLCSSLEASGMISHINNPLLVQELVNKLPAQTKLNWSLHIGKTEADVVTFSSWLFELAEAATRVSNIGLPSKGNASLHSHIADKSSEGKSNCNVCDMTHSLQECKKFAALKLNERWNIIKTHKLCRTCLKKHKNFRCSEAKCSVQGCEARHHRLLHKFVENRPTVTTHSSKSNPEVNTNTYFKILPVVLHHNGRSIEVYALLDDGSNVTLVDEDVCDYLGVEGETETLCLRWTSGTTRKEENSMNVNLLTSSIGQNTKKFELSNVQTVKHLCLPSQTMDDKLVKYYKHLKNLPIKTYVNAIPKLLIGLNNGYLTNTLKMAEGYSNEPCASKTRLGWVVHGGGVS